MAKANSKTSPIHLHYRSVEKVLVEPDDKDRFIMTAREAARACKHMEKQAEVEKEWIDKFNQFLVYISNWCKEHRKDVLAAYVDVSDGALSILICTEGDGYRFDLDDTLTDLDLAIVREFPWCVAEVMQMPKKAKDGQMSFEKAILVYGNGKRSQETGDS
jgi:hypothetical protein